MSARDITAMKSFAKKGKPKPRNLSFAHGWKGMEELILVLLTPSSTTIGFLI
jgi:hypothetical protein